MSRIHTALSLAASVLLASTGTAFAHAHLHAASPADKAVTAAPTEIDLTFTEELNLAFSGAELLGPDGKAIKLGDGTLKEGGKLLMVPISAPLAPGDYKVNWHVLSTDGHKTNGSYGFTVKP